MRLALSLKECPRGGHITEREVGEIIFHLSELKAGFPIVIPPKVVECLRCHTMFLAGLTSRQMSQLAIGGD